MAQESGAPTLVEGYKHGRVPRAVREQQILDVAEELFATRGYENTSIEDIARAAGVSRPIVYEHHGSKEGIYLACVRRARSALEEAMVAAAASTTDPMEQLERAAGVYFSTLERDPNRWAVLFGTTTPLVGGLGDELTDLRFETVGRIAALLRAHAPDTDPERLEAFAHAVSGVGEQLGRWWLRNPGIPRERVIAHYRDVIWAGVRQLLPPDGEPRGRSGSSSNVT